MDTRIIDMARRNWSKEETIIALYLYCQIPFSKISKSNPNIIKYANLIDRTPSALALKMCNLASVDPTLRQNGMNHSSKLDYAVFDEFYDNWDALVQQAYVILRKLNQTELFENYSKSIPLGSDKSAVVKQRIGQDFFRRSVLASYNMSCCITGLSNSKLLIASHIKPWSKSTNEEKTNPCNGLCLNSFHDSLFDKGYMSLDEDFKIILSSELRKTEIDMETRDWLFSYEGKQIQLPHNKVFAPNKSFLEFHRDTIFLP